MADGDASISKEEQASRARALADKCFLAGNVRSARQWMQSALRLAPGLPGTAQIVAAYDVHAAAAARKPPDWYAVLGLRPPVAHDDVKRQHRRLCLLVHPDKNPSAAADGAFKLVQAAWLELSARHPPGAAPPPPPRPPPPPPPRPQPPPRAPEPRPQVVQMRRRPSAPPPTPPPRARPSYAQQASAPKPPEKGGQGSPMPTAAGRASPDKCLACGAWIPNGKSGFWCGSCHWSPMDGRADDDDDDFFEDYYF